MRQATTDQLPAANSNEASRWSNSELLPIHSDPAATSLRYASMPCPE